MLEEKEIKLYKKIIVKQVCYCLDKKVILFFNRIHSSLLYSVLQARDKFKTKDVELYICSTNLYRKIQGLDITIIQWCRDNEINTMSLKTLNELKDSP